MEESQEKLDDLNLLNDSNSLVDREQKQTAHFSVQPVSNETGFSSVSPKPQQTHDFNRGYKTEGFGDDYKKLIYCPYCESKLVRKGKRKKKYETIQIYYCKNCRKKLTPIITKNKTYPLRIIIDCLSLHNKLYSSDKIVDIIEKNYGIKISSRIILEWLKEYSDYLPFLRMREFAFKKFSENKKDFIEESKLFHQQIYNFKFHRAKLNFILNEEFKHFKFRPLLEFLELVIAECPHQIFQDSKRSSEFKDINGKTLFNLNEVKIIEKYNQACKTAGFVMQAVSNNKLRHEKLQEFMLYNDSCTIAVEVPILINNEDIKHYKYELDFEIPDLNLNYGEYITGHIDLIQIRNGMIHIMDFKPSASKEKPITQLVLYALALSRLTGLRLYHFKCSWFDDKNYYEFFPLHVVYKKNRKRKKLDMYQKRLEN